MKILVTGASGRVGSVLTRRLIENHEVYSGFNSVQPSYGIPTRTNLTESNTLKSTLLSVKPQAIIHCASISDVRLCESNKELANTVNIIGTMNLVQLAESVKPYFVYVSTNAVFSGEKGWYTETDVPNPINHYGETMAKGESIIAESSLDSLIIRTSMVYGQLSNQRDFSAQILSSLRQGRAFHASNQYLSPTFNQNLADMIHECCEKRVTGILHLAGAQRVTRFEFAREFAKVFRFNHSSIQEIEVDPNTQRDYSLSVAKAKRLLANKPMGITQGLIILKGENN